MRSPTERVLANGRAVEGATGARITRIAASAHEAKIELDNGTVLDFSPFLFPGPAGAMGLRIDCRQRRGVAAPPLARPTPGGGEA